jgi:hypothetical protein
VTKITEVYERYKITKSLQEHQLRVAAVASQICDSLTIPIDKDVVTKACLIHDMGNILKFDFSVSAALFEPEGIEYWKQIKAEVSQKYQTNDEHELSLIIARELGADNRILACIESLSFTKAEANLARKAIEPKICDNADLRASPLGVVSLDERLEEGRRRYKGREEYWIKAGDWDRLAKACHDLEDQIFRHSKIRPSDITNESTNPIMEQLRTYEI